MRKQRACKLREPMVPDTVSVTVFWAEVSEHIDGKKRSARRKLARTPCVTHQNATVLCFTRMPHGSDNAEVDFQEVQAPADAQDNKPNGEKGSLLTKKLLKLQKSYARRGVIYISRIPPHMVHKQFSLLDSACCTRACQISTCLQKPQKLRHLLEQYGAIGRVYCAPEGITLSAQLPAHGSLPYKAQQTPLPATLLHNRRHAHTAAPPAETLLVLLQIQHYASSASRREETQAKTLRRDG